MYVKTWNFWKRLQSFFSKSLYSFRNIFSLLLYILGQRYDINSLVDRHFGSTSYLKVFWDILIAAFPKKLCGRFAKFQTGPVTKKTSYTTYYLSSNQKATNVKIHFHFLLSAEAVRIRVHNYSKTGLREIPIRTWILFSMCLVCQLISNNEKHYAPFLR